MDASRATESHSHPPGRRHWPLGLVLLALFATLVLLVHLELTVRRSDRPLLTYDSAEYALAGRQLSRTGTLGTWFVHPDELSAPRRPPFPLIVGHPLVPILNAAVFAVAGASPARTLVPAALAYLLLVVAAAALARRLSGSTSAGLAAGAAVALAPRVLYFAAEGLTEIPFAAAFVVALLLLRDFPARPRPLALGLALGVAHLARPIMAPMLPAWLLGIALATPPRARVRTLATVVAGFLACALPLALYKLAAAGDPLADVARFNLLSHLSPELEPVRVHRMLEPPAPLAYLAAHPGAVVAKVARFGPAMAFGAFAQAGWCFAPLFLLHLLRRPRETGEAPFRLTLVAAVALFVALVTLSLPNPRYLFPLLPVLLAVGACELRALARAARVRPAVAAFACAALVAAGPGLATVNLWRQAWPAGISDRGGFTEREWRTLGGGLAARLPAGAVAASDVGPLLAWYGERATVLIPNAPEELPALERRLPLDAVVLTNHWLIGQPGSEGWRALYFGVRSLPGWSRSDSVTAGRLRAVVFTRARTAGIPWLHPQEPEAGTGRDP